MSSHGNILHEQMFQYFFKTNVKFSISFFLSKFMQMRYQEWQHQLGDIDRMNTAAKYCTMFSNINASTQQQDAGGLIKPKKQKQKNAVTIQLFYEGWICKYPMSEVTAVDY